MALSYLGVDNFRMFGANGKMAEFNFAPITILTGPNNSGKSSLIKAINLLKHNFEKSDAPDLEFEDDNYYGGTFEHCINNVKEHIKFQFIITPALFNIHYQINDEPLDDDLTAWKIPVGNLRLSYRMNELDTNKGLLNEILIGIISENKSINDYAIKIYFPYERRLSENHKYFTIKFNNDIISKIIGPAFDAPFPYHLHNAYYENPILFELDNFSFTLPNELKIKYTRPPLNFSEILDFMKREFLNRDYFKKQFMDYFKGSIEEKDGELASKILKDEFDIEGIYNKVDDVIIDKLIELFSEWFLSINHYNELMPNIFLNSVFGNIFYIPPFREYPKSKFINHGEDKNTYQFLKEFEKQYKNLRNHWNVNININSKKYEVNESPILFSFIMNWLLKFDIGIDIDLENKENLAMSVKVKKNVLITDQHLKNDFKTLDNFGFGISQLLMVLMKVFSESYNFSEQEKNVKQFSIIPQIMIEEPESHLHPKLQSLLADFFADAYKTFGIHFIIETHSEYLIRKLQYLIAKKIIKKEDVAIYYFDQDPTKEDYIRKMEIDDNGFMKGDFGEGFFDEASKLISDLWNVQSQN